MSIVDLHAHSAQEENNFYVLGTCVSGSEEWRGEVFYAVCPYRSTWTVSWRLLARTAPAVPVGLQRCAVSPRDIENDERHITHGFWFTQRTPSYSITRFSPASSFFREPYRMVLYRVGQKTGLFLTVCNSRICWHKIAFYISNCSIFIRSKTDVLCVTVFKYSLRNISVTTLRSR